jgi:hypothetical protein
VGVTRTFFGLSRDNPATPVDESGAELLANPESEGDYAFTAFVRSTWDADGDGIDSGMDTCPLNVNVGSPFEAGSGDDDGDGLDNVCDPAVHKAPTDQDGDGIFNRGDNCLPVSIRWATTPTDGIGDIAIRTLRTRYQAEDVTDPDGAHRARGRGCLAGIDHSDQADGGPPGAVRHRAGGPLVLGAGIAAPGVARSRRGEGGSCAFRAGFFCPVPALGVACGGGDGKRARRRQSTGRRGLRSGSEGSRHRVQAGSCSP